MEQERIIIEVAVEDSEPFLRYSFPKGMKETDANFDKYAIILEDDENDTELV